uniref:Uncharacterized protein n=1 Tax=Anguilla anguilla TaxID=7936 RepID=A0A0E9WID8_ANGAN
MTGNLLVWLGLHSKEILTDFAFSVTKYACVQPMKKINTDFELVLMERLVILLSTESAFIFWGFFMLVKHQH